MQNRCRSTNSPLLPTTHKFELGFIFKPVLEAEIREQLTSLKLNKATAYDHLPVNILKVSASRISKHLAAIINSSFELGIFPSVWKIAKVSPILKGTPPANDCDNYRPTSVLPSLAKVCECVADNQVKGYGKDHRTLKESLQFAYTKYCSKATALIKVIDSWKLAVDNKKYTVAVFLDLRKAFESIDHSLLLKRLCDYGFDENAIRWFDSYLTGRQQCVTYQNTQSTLDNYCMVFLKDRYWAQHYSAYTIIRWCTASRRVITSCMQMTQKLTPHTAT